MGINLARLVSINIDSNKLINYYSLIIISITLLLLTIYL